MKTELIEVIKKTIHVLENDLVYYDWMRSTSCNCGILAQQIGINPDHILSQISTVDDHSLPGGPWTRCSRLQSKCEATGKPLQEVFKKLFDLGLSFKDIGNLENLSDENILKKMGGTHKVYHGRNSRRGEKTEVIKYLKAWTELLEEENAPNEKPVRREIKVEGEIIIVDMDSKARQLPKEIVYN